MAAFSRKCKPMAEIEDNGEKDPQVAAAAEAPCDGEGQTMPDGPVADENGMAGEPDTAAGEVDLRVLEALLFASRQPLTPGRLAELLELSSTKPVRQAVRALNQHYASTGRSFRVEQVAGGYQLLTLPEYGEYLSRLARREGESKLSKSALETLAIIAYKQPIMRADIEAIRGVACGETIRSLMEKHLVRITGRAELPGRPILYGTTKRFLEVFGLNSIKDLPVEPPDNPPASPSEPQAPAPTGES